MQFYCTTELSNGFFIVQLKKKKNWKITMLEGQRERKQEGDGRLVLFIFFFLPWQEFKSESPKLLNKKFVCIYLEKGTK